MDFITSEMFLTFAGCLTIVAILTQVFKSLPGFNKINPTWIVLLFSTIVGVIRIIFMKDYSAEGILIGILNIFAIYLGAIGGYETTKQIGKGINNQKKSIK